MVVLFLVVIVITLGGRSEKILLWVMSESVWPMFSSKSFIVFCLIFRSLIHCEFILCMVLESVLISFFYMWLSSFVPVFSYPSPPAPSPFSDLALCPFAIITMSMTLS